MNTRARLGKLRLSLQPFGGLLTPLTVAIVGILGSQLLARRQNADTNARLYSELMSKRDDAENGLRKEMLFSVLQHYLDKSPPGLEARAMQLELLARNVQASFDLKPLFDDFVRELGTSSDSRSDDYRQRIKAAARSATSLQLAALAGHSHGFARSVDLDELKRAGGAGIALASETIQMEGVTDSTISIRVLKADAKLETLLIRLEARGEESLAPEVRVVFSVGYFDFPNTANTRLPNGTYCAVTLQAMSLVSAEIVTTCYPAAYSVVKDRPYFEEAVKQLRAVGPPH